MSTWQDRANDVIAQGCLTYSKRADQWVEGVYPTHCTHAKGIDLHAADGKIYKDWYGGLGSNLLDCSNNYSLPTIYEVELAEKIRSLVPCCEKLRLLKTGSEACQAAVRIARAYKENSGRPKGRICGIGTGYHGFHNWCIARENPGTGTIDELYVKTTDDRLVKEVSTGCWDYVIIEPVQLDIGKERIAMLQALRRECDRTGTILIFDEVITGFRTPKYCVSNYAGIQPDIICLGKALGNGHPIAVVGGKREIMDTPGWFVSSTFAGEVSSIMSALDVLRVLTPDSIERLWAKGQAFQEAFNELSPRIQMKGIPTKAVWVGEEIYKAIFFQEMCKRGLLIGKAWHITFAHTFADCAEFIDTAADVIAHIEAGAVGLEGKLPQEIFRRY